MQYLVRNASTPSLSISPISLDVIATRYLQPHVDTLPHGSLMFYSSLWYASFYVLITFTMSFPSSFFASPRLPPHFLNYYVSTLRILHIRCLSHSPSLSRLIARSPACDYTSTYGLHAPHPFWTLYSSHDVANVVRCTYIL